MPKTVKTTREGVRISDLFEDAVNLGDIGSLLPFY